MLIFGIENIPNSWFQCDRFGIFLKLDRAFDVQYSLWVLTQIVNKSRNLTLKISKLLIVLPRKFGHGTSIDGFHIQFLEEGSIYTSIFQHDCVLTLIWLSVSEENLGHCVKLSYKSCSTESFFSYALYILFFQQLLNITLYSRN